jgi:hypothetical protein
MYERVEPRRGVGQTSTRAIVDAVARDGGVSGRSAARARRLTRASSMFGVVVLPERRGARASAQ